MESAVRKRTNGSEFEEKRCLIRAASFDLLTLWNVFVELWTSHGQTGSYSGPEVGFEEIGIDVLQARLSLPMW